jgi:hypothetical protein
VVTSSWKPKISYNLYHKQNNFSDGYFRILSFEEALSLKDSLDQAFSDYKKYSS